MNGTYGAAGFRDHHDVGHVVVANPMLAVLDALRISIGLSIMDLITISNIKR